MIERTRTSVGRWLGSALAIGHASAALAACNSAPPAAATAINVTPAPGTGDARVALPSPEPHAYLVRTGSALAVVRGATEAEVARDGVVVCDLGHPALLRKLTNESGVLGRLARASAAAPASFYVKIDGGIAPPTEDARRAAFVAVGVQAQTIAGDIATVRVAPERFGALLGVPWVASIETPGITLPR